MSDSEPAAKPQPQVSHRGRSAAPIASSNADGEEVPEFEPFGLMPRGPPPLRGEEEKEPVCVCGCVYVCVFECVCGVRQRETEVCLYVRVLVCESVCALVTNEKRPYIDTFPVDLGC